MSAGRRARGRLHGPVPALVGLVVAAVLAGCATVPTAGPIEQGPVVDSVESTQFIRVIAAPPSQGASPAEIVRGFLEASASLEQDHAIARRYLTERASEQWDPGARTAVYEESSLEVRSRGTGCASTSRSPASCSPTARCSAARPPSRWASA